MAIYYVGMGGSDSNNGQSWANRKLTLNGAEDLSLSAGDTVYVGPGVYREKLTCDASGSAGGGNIVFVGDVLGENTDGVGGLVVITGSDNDQSATRDHCVESSGITHRTFRGFAMGWCTNDAMELNSNATDWVIEDCSFISPGSCGVYFDNKPEDNIVRRCLFMGAAQYQHAVRFYAWSAQDSCDNLIENCIILSGSNYCSGIGISGPGDGEIRNCLIWGCHTGLIVAGTLNSGHGWDVNNCIFAYNQTAITAGSTNNAIEDYNTFFGNGTDRTNTNTGSNSQAYFPSLLPPIFTDGHMLPWMFGALAPWSALTAITGTNTPSDDLFGLSRPATASKLSWGPIQFVDAERETTTTYDSSDASLKLADAGELFLGRVLVANESTTFSVRVNRETNYAGTNPQLIVRQSGQSDDTTTDTGSASAWNELTTTLTPAALPAWVDVYVKSNNTATSGSYAVYVDALAVS